MSIVTVWLILTLQKYLDFLTEMICIIFYGWSGTYHVFGGIIGLDL